MNVVTIGAPITHFLDVAPQSLLLATSTAVRAGIVVVIGAPLLLELLSPGKIPQPGAPGILDEGAVVSIHGVVHAIQAPIDEIVGLGALLEVVARVSFSQARQTSKVVLPPARVRT